MYILIRWIILKLYLQSAHNAMPCACVCWIAALLREWTEYGARTKCTCSRWDPSCAGFTGAYRASQLRYTI